jgi:intracellular multiplication protein IcmW
MPELSAKASHEYWRQYPDPTIIRVLCHIESAEAARDQHTLRNIVLQELGKALDNLKTVDLNKLEEREAIIKVANQLNMAQTLRLLQALDTAQPGSAAQLLMHAETITNQSQDEAGIFLQRNLVFERLRLLSRVFSEERLTLVLNALKEDH